MDKESVKGYKPEVVSLDATNGGRRSSVESISGALADLLPHVPKAERLSGSDKKFKLFFHVADDASTPLIGAHIWLDRPTAGEDWVTIFKGTATDTAGDLTGNERHYGAAYLKVDVAVNSKTLVVVCEDASLASGVKQIFQAGDTAIVTMKANPESVTGDEEERVIESVTVSGREVTIVFTVALTKAYAVSGGGRVCSVLPLGDIRPIVNGVTATTAGDGGYDHSAEPVALNSLGAVSDIIRLQLTDANAFTATLVSNGASLGTGNRGSDFAPLNPETSKPYVTALSAGWTGTWQAGDRLEIDCSASAFSVWENRVVPIDCASLTGNRVEFGIGGEY